MRNFLVYKNAIIAIAFEISSLHSETQIDENKGRLKLPFLHYNSITIRLQFNTTIDSKIQSI